MCRIITKTGVTVNGKVLVPCQYDDIIPAMVDGAESRELFLAMQSGEMEVIKIDEKDPSYKRSKQYHNVYSFNNGVAVVSKKYTDGRYKHGLINADLEVLLRCDFDGVAPMSDRLYAVSNDGKQGIYDTIDKKFIVPVEFPCIEYDEEEQKITFKL